MILDRTIPPTTGEFPPLVLPAPDRYTLSNGIEIIACNRGDEEVCRIDLMMEGGIYTEMKPGSASLTMLMLREGAAGRSSNEIAEELDYHGAWLQTSVSNHYLYITLYTLNRHIETCLAILSDIVRRPDFPEKEFEQLKERRIQQRRIQLEKVDTLASEAFSTQLFGGDHPYGRVASIEDIAHLTLKDLRSYYRQYVGPQQCRIFVSGKITAPLLHGLEEHFGASWLSLANASYQPDTPAIQPASRHRLVVHKANALQSGIRMGLPVINREHPDFFALKLVNTILGGYFGSRLMSNVREEKGYTYGIGSGIIALRHGAYLTISTQAGTAFTQPLIDEVFAEVKRLREELVSDEELTTVRNYQRGEMARVLDSPFSIADYYQSLWANNLSVDYFARQDEVVRQLTAENLIEVARRYLLPEQFYIAIAGDSAHIPHPE